MTLSLQQKKRFIESLGGHCWLPRAALPYAKLGCVVSDLVDEFVNDNLVVDNLVDKRPALISSNVLPILKIPEQKFEINVVEAAAPIVPLINPPLDSPNSLPNQITPKDSQALIRFNLYIERVGRVLFVIEPEIGGMPNLSQREFNLLSDIKRVVRGLFREDLRFIDVTHHVTHFSWPPAYNARLSFTEQDACAAVEGLIHGLGQQAQFELIFCFGWQACRYVAPALSQDNKASLDIYLAEGFQLPFVFAPSLADLLGNATLKKQLWDLFKKIQCQKT